MTHFEVICPICAGGAQSLHCTFECEGELQPRIQKSRSIRLFFAMTCHECGARHDCEYVWDWYNTNGDCLAEK